MVVKATGLSVSIGKLKLQNPIMVASGTFGYGEEFEDLVSLKDIGAIITKSITQTPYEGNPPPRIWETTAGMLNAIGLQNEGVYDFIKISAISYCSKDSLKMIGDIAITVANIEGLEAHAESIKKRIKN